MRQFNTFRRPFGAAGEKDHGRVVSLPLRDAEGGTRKESVTEGGAAFGESRDAAADIFQKDQLDAGFGEGINVEFRALQESARADNVL